MRHFWEEIPAFPVQHVWKRRKSCVLSTAWVERRRKDSFIHSGVYLSSEIKQKNPKMSKMRAWAGLSFTSCFLFYLDRFNCICLFNYLYTIWYEYKPRCWRAIKPPRVVTRAVITSRETPPQVKLMFPTSLNVSPRCGVLFGKTLLQPKNNTNLNLFKNIGTDVGGASVSPRTGTFSLLDMKWIKRVV